MLLRPLAVVLAFLALAPVATAAPAPADLRGFLLRANDPQPAGHAFPRTPAFAWDNVKGASSYEFQLATSKNFSENSIVWEKADLPNPITSVPLTLPWITGNPYSLYARVRANVGGDATSWSTKYGFKMKAPAAPTSLSNGANPTPGMVRWTPVEGATAYEVSFLWDLANGQNKKIKTSTTAADLRELYAFANDLGAQGLTNVSWRVRAMRELEGKPLNEIPVVSYGPWSPTNVTVEPNNLGPGADLPRGVGLAQPHDGHLRRARRPEPRARTSSSPVSGGAASSRSTAPRAPARRSSRPPASPARSSASTSSRTRTA